MQEVYILLGGNLGDRLYYMQTAQQEIDKHIGSIIQQSSYYETAPWGFEDDNKFINQVLYLKTDISEWEVLQLTQAIEKKLGRKAKTKDTYESRKIDIDILFYGSKIVNKPQLHLPHLRLHERRFTLVPLVEIAPNLMHPIFRKSAQELLLMCDDDGEVKVLSLAEAV